MNLPDSPLPGGDVEVERDDAIIGVAFRKSLLAFGGIVAVVAAVLGVQFLMREPPPPGAPVGPAPVVKVRDAIPLTLPSIPFRDVTAEVGLAFVHENGAAGEKLLPETMGGGVAFLDYDSDGDQDILLVNSNRWPWDVRPASDKPATSALYQNDGTGQFTDVTHEAGLAIPFYGMGVAVGDYDNDGDADLCFSAVGQNRLFRNEGGKFIENTVMAGVGGPEDQWSSGIGWFDYDNDGDLDLWVCRYVVWNRETDLKQEFKLVGTERGYGRPFQFQATDPALYRNNGDQTFTDVSAAMGIQVREPQTGSPSGKSLGLTFADVNHDGWLDVLVANDTVQNFLFLNRAGKSFEEVGRPQGIAFSPEGTARAGMGIDVGMFREGTGDCGVVIGNFANEMTALYVAPEGTESFTDEAVPTGLGPQTRLVLTFAVLFLDADLDGRLDLFCSNGHLEEDISRVQESQSYEQPAQLFWNAGVKQATEFVPLTSKECGDDLFRPIVGRGAASADIDNDGDLDLLVGACGRSPRLLRNEQSSGQHWLRVALRGTKSNRDAIGAEVTLKAGGVTQTRMVNPTRGYQSQSERIVSFGLGGSDKIDSVEIRWPGGAVQRLDNIAGDRTLSVEQAQP